MVISWIVAQVKYGEGIYGEGVYGGQGGGISPWVWLQIAGIVLLFLASFLLIRWGRIKRRQRQQAPIDPSSMNNFNNL